MMFHHLFPFELITIIQQKYKNSCLFNKKVLENIAFFQKGVTNHCDHAHLK